MDRRAAAKALSTLAFCAELTDDARVDAAAATSLGWALRTFEGTAAALWRLPGMTPQLLGVVDDALHGRTSPLLRELMLAVPEGLLEVRLLKGLGPKKVRTLWDELGVTSLGELEYACNENRLLTLKGFGEKTQRNVLAQIATLRSQHGAMRLDEARALLLPLVEALESTGARADLGSDARRAVEVVRDLRLVTTAPRQSIAALLTPLLPAAGADTDGVDDADAAPDDAAPADAPEKDPAGGVVVLHAGHARIHVVCADDGGYARALLHATGSAGHLDKLRHHARERGLVLEELVAADEAGIYRALGLVPSDPLRRDDGVPLVLEGKAAPKLVARGDLTGALHNHTTASDGVASLSQMAAAAAARGLSWLGITDHSQSAGYAHGLDAARLLAQRDEIVAHNRSGAACTLLAGVESDILRDGDLDYPDAVLAELDVVVASVHQRYSQRGPAMTARMVAAARHPGVHVIGHPTGRLLLSRPATELDVSALVEACAASGCALELNANPARLDLAVEHLVLCRERGVLVSIAADAHSEAALDHLDYGVMMARRAGLCAEHVLNARPLAEVRRWLGARASTSARASA